MCQFDLSKTMLKKATQQEMKYNTKMNINDTKKNHFWEINMLTTLLPIELQMKNLTSTHIVYDSFF